MCRVLLSNIASREFMVRISAIILLMATFNPVKTPVVYAQTDYSSCFFLSVDDISRQEDATAEVIYPFRLNLKDSASCVADVQTINLTISSLDDTATAGQDYKALFLELHLSPSDFVDNDYPLSVTILPDSVYEGDEHFWIALSGVEIVFGNGTHLAVPLVPLQGWARAAIRNYRPDDPFIMSNPAPYTVPVDLTTSEDGTSVEVQVWLGFAPIVPVTIDIHACATLADCASPEITLSTSRLEYTTADYNVPQSFTVTGIDDTRPEKGDERSNGNYWIYLTANYPNSVYDQSTVMLAGYNVDNEPERDLGGPSGAVLRWPDVYAQPSPNFFTGTWQPENVESRFQPFLVGKRLLAIYRGTPMVAYIAPQGEMFTISGNQPVVLPLDNDLNGYDLYTAFYYTRIGSEIWVALGVGEHAQFWVLLP